MVAKNLPLLSNLWESLQEDGNNCLIEVSTDGEWLNGVTASWLLL